MFQGENFCRIVNELDSDNESFYNNFKENNQEIVNNFEDALYYLYKLSLKEQ
jgi:hypothetical protein